MCRFIESICSIDGKAQNLSHHQERVDRTFLHHFDTQPFQLAQALKSLPEKGKYKIRIVYGMAIESIGFHPYQLRDVRTLKLVETNEINYTFKYHNREMLDRLLEQRGVADDIVIVKDGQITDSSYSNLAFFDGRQWFTPVQPLLKGTKREKYVRKGILEERDISVDEFRAFKKLCLINAMMDLGDIELSVSAVV